MLKKLLDKSLDFGISLFRFDEKKSCGAKKFNARTVESYAQLFFVKTQGAILRLSHSTIFPPFYLSANFLRKRKSLLTCESNISAGAVYTYPVTISKLICSSGHSSVSCKRKIGLTILKVFFKCQNVINKNKHRAEKHSAEKHTA